MSKPGDRVKLSKALSWLLRHNAETQGFQFVDGGILSVEAILNHGKFKGWTTLDVIDVVDNCEKKRFTMKTGENGELLIRANQGHSIKSGEVELTEITDPEMFTTVIHGTYFKAWKLIESTGRVVLY